MLEKISRETPDLTQENIDKLLELFPQVATEIEDTASAQHSTAQHSTAQHSTALSAE